MDFDFHKPLHLLNFEGDPDLQFSYRSLVLSNKHGTTTTQATKGLGLCAACHSTLSMEGRPRLKPLERLTKTVQKLMTKKANKIPLSRFENFKLSKFMKNSQQMMVRCTECGYVNKTPIIGRQALVKLKEERILKVKKDSEKDEIIQEEEPVVEGKKKRKRPKKKKKKDTPRRNPNSLLTDGEEEEEEECTAASNPIPQTPLMMSSGKQKKHSAVSLSNFFNAVTPKELSSRSLLEMAVNAKTPTSTPLSSKSTPVATKTKSNGKKEKTKNNMIAKSAMTTPSKKKSSILVHKQLRKFLKESTHVQEKSPSIQDFLTML